MDVPTIATAPLAIMFYPNSAELQHSPYASQLVPLINEAFRDRAVGFLNMHRRVDDLPSLMEELGSDSFSYALVSVPATPAEAAVLYGVGSAHIYDPTRRVGIDDRFTMWSYRSPADDDLAGVVRWEIKLLVTDPRLQRQGLGSFIMDLLGLEIRRRTRKQNRTTSESGQSKKCERCQLLLTTVKELNAHYYERLGYRIVNEIHVPSGSFELDGETSTKDFTVISMNRYMDIHEP